MKIFFKHSCQYYECLFNSSTPHDNFLTCESSQDIKMKRLKSIETEINKLFTPPKVGIIILAQLKSFYHNTPIENFNPKQIERCEITSNIESQNRIS